MAPPRRSTRRQSIDEEVETPQKRTSNARTPSKRSKKQPAEEPDDVEEQVTEEIEKEVAEEPQATASAEKTEQTTTEVKKRKGPAVNPPVFAPSQTIYIKNLSSKLNKWNTRWLLYGLCSQYGQILDVVQVRREGMRGQAHVVFKEVVMAVEAMRSLQGFPFWGRPLEIQFAKETSKAARDFERHALEPSRQQRTAQLNKN